MNADEIIAMLGLEPHPEGGHFRETFRDAAQTIGGRAASTAIYFLLGDHEVSRWHRVDAVEVWHWYAGAALILETSDGGGAHERHRLGHDLAAGHRPQAIVPARHWQCARSQGGWTLVGCTVAPGFQFSGFELASGSFDPARQSAPRIT